MSTGLSHAALVDELGRRATAKDRVLARLLAAGHTGVLNTELNAICYRYGARVFELARDGYRIEKLHVSRGVWRYILQPRDRLF